MPRPYPGPIKPEGLGVGQTWVLSALPSCETHVQMNLRITDCSFCPPAPNTTSYPLLWKGDQRLLFPHGRAVETRDQGRQVTCCPEEGPETESKTPNWRHSFPDSGHSYCLPATGLPNNHERRTRGWSCFSTTV